MMKYVFAVVMSVVVISHADAEQLPKFIKLNCTYYNYTTKMNERRETTVPDATFGRLHVNEYHIVDIQDAHSLGIDEMIDIYNSKNGDYKMVIVNANGLVTLLH